MVRLLAMDTSSDRCTVGLMQGDTVIIRSAGQQRAHAQLLLPLVEDALASSGISLQQLDALAVIAGPGSFTGLRIAVGAVQGLALAAGKPVVLLSTMEALAWTARLRAPCSTILVAMQARDREIYFALYSENTDGQLLLREEERVGAVMTAADLAPWLRGREWIAAGDAWQVPERLIEVLGSQPSAIMADLELDMERVCRLAARQWSLGKAVPADMARPRYLKEQMDYKVSST